MRNRLLQLKFRSIENYFLNILMNITMCEYTPADGGEWCGLYPPPLEYGIVGGIRKQASFLSRVLRIRSAEPASR